MILEDKTVVVCGVGVGLGREVARLALRDGANAVLGARTEGQLAKIAGELDPSGERTAWCATDVTDPARCAALVDTAVERFGAVDALVQVAARDAVFGGLADTPEEDWRATFETNVLGTTRVIRAVAPHLERRGGGSIVLVGSQASFLPQVQQIAYAASKGALHSAMFFMAKELGPARIRVNTVVPTWMWGPPVEGFLEGRSRETGRPLAELVGEITSQMAIPEIPADEDVAEAAIFLCSDRARMITGQSLFVNAGELMR